MSKKEIIKHPVGDKFVYTEVVKGADKKVSENSALAQKKANTALIVDFANSNACKRKENETALNNRVDAESKLDKSEMRLNDIENQTTTWADAVSAIEDKYPIPHEDLL